MRARILALGLGVLCLGVGLLAAPQARAAAVPVVCNPAGAVCVNQPCDHIGRSTIDFDRKNLIACLENDSGSLEWKSMTSALPSVADSFRAIRVSFNKDSVAFCPRDYPYVVSCRVMDDQTPKSALNTAITLREAIASGFFFKFPPGDSFYGNPLLAPTDYPAAEGGNCGPGTWFTTAAPSEFVYGKCLAAPCRNNGNVNNANCNAENESKIANPNYEFDRTELASDYAQIELVVAPDGVTMGCWAYDRNHTRLESVMEIMCAK